MNTIQLAAKMYQCRDTCKGLWGNEWKDKLKSHTELIKAVMQKELITNEIEAALRLICKAEESKIEGMEVFALKIMAAAVEMIEPSC